MVVVYRLKTVALEDQLCISLIKCRSGNDGSHYRRPQKALESCRSFLGGPTGDLKYTMPWSFQADSSTTTNVASQGDTINIASKVTQVLMHKYDKTFDWIPSCEETANT